LEGLARKVASELGIEATFTKVKEMGKVVAYDITSTPALVINEEVKTSGRIPRREEIAEWIRAAQKG